MSLHQITILLALLASSALGPANAANEGVQAPAEASAAPVAPATPPVVAPQKCPTLAEVPDCIAKDGLLSLFFKNNHSACFEIAKYYNEKLTSSGEDANKACAALTQDLKWKEPYLLVWRERKSEATWECKVCDQPSAHQPNVLPQEGQFRAIVEATPKPAPVVRREVVGNDDEVVQDTSLRSRPSHRNRRDDDADNSDSRYDSRSNNGSSLFSGNSMMPMLGGALIGGLLGYMIGRNNQQQQYYNPYFNPQSMWNMNPASSQMPPPPWARPPMFGPPGMGGPFGFGNMGQQFSPGFNNFGLNNQFGSPIYNAPVMLPPRGP